MNAANPRPPLTGSQSQAVAAGDERTFRDLFEKCARRFHDFNVTQGAVLHRNWKFENCPAEACASARKALGLRVNPLGDKPGPESVNGPGRVREPGEEG